MLIMYFALLLGEFHGFW